MTKTVLTLEEYESKLKTEGYAYLDDGSFAVVYLHPTKDRVIKVFANDIPYLTFIKRVRKLKNTYFPKVFKIETFKSIRKPTLFTVVEMEKLTPLTELPIEEQDEIINRFGKYIYTEEYIASNYSDSSSIEFDTVIRQYRESKDKAFNKACDLLCDLEEQISPCQLDCHGGNVMIRKENNQLVFTDPLWSGDWMGGR